MRCLGLTLADDIPDSRTIWVFSERFTGLGLVKELFEVFESCLQQLDLVGNEGKLVDASFLEASGQCNSREETDRVKSVTPSNDVLGRVFSLLDSGQFSQCFTNWFNEVATLSGGQVVSIGGKTLPRLYG